MQRVELDACWERQLPSASVLGTAEQTKLVGLGVGKGDGEANHCSLCSSQPRGCGHFPGKDRGECVICILFREEELGRVSPEGLGF